jgi:hypothetical protein
VPFVFPEVEASASNPGLVLSLATSDRVLSSSAIALLLHHRQICATRRLLHSPFYTGRPQRTTAYVHPTTVATKMIVLPAFFTSQDRVSLDFCA